MGFGSTSEGIHLHLITYPDGVLHVLFLQTLGSLAGGLAGPQEDPSVQPQRALQPGSRERCGSSSSAELERGEPSFQWICAMTLIDFAV